MLWRVLVWSLTIQLLLSSLGDSRAVAQPAATEAPVVEAVEEPVTDEAADPGDEPPSLLTSEESEVDEEYFELLRLFADTLDQVERNYVETVSRRELLEAAIEGVLAKLDQYSDYIGPEQLDSFRRGVENEFGGIGIRVGQIDGKLTVVTPLVNTPAYRAGILAGDQIIGIGDEETDGLSLEDAIDRMKGKIGSEIKLKIRPEGEGAERDVILKRELVLMETVFGHHRQSDDVWDFMFDPQHHIGYIRISTFSRHTSEDLKKALDGLTAAGMKALILDLRFNPGGLLSTAVEVADMFLAKGTIVSTAGRNTAERTWSATQDGTYEGFEMAVLVNGYSASASEIVAACLQDHQRAVVIGERTWGKGSVQNIIELEGGRSALKLTTAGYRRPSGKNIDRFEGAADDDEWGVKPDSGLQVDMSPNQTRRLLAYQRQQDVLRIPANRDETPPEAYVDPQWQAAADYLIKSMKP